MYINDREFLKYETNLNIFLIFLKHVTKQINYLGFLIDSSTNITDQHRFLINVKILSLTLDSSLIQQILLINLDSS